MHIFYIHQGQKGYQMKLCLALCLSLIGVMVFSMDTTFAQISSSKIPKTPKTQIFGDVNYDGKANSTDALIIQSYLNGIPVPIDKQGTLGPEFTPDQYRRADVNMDGSISHMDTILILQFDVGLIKNLPIKAKNYGDVNLDGKVDSTDALMVQTFVEMKFCSMKGFYNADVNGDKKVTHIDSYLILQYDVGLIPSLPVFPNHLGDVDNDGLVNSTDALRILTFAEKGDSNAIPALVNADVNYDGFISEMDAYIILQYDVGLIKELPVLATVYGDVDEDNTVNSEDALRIKTAVELKDYNSIYNIANADVNLNGRIDGIDAALILEFDIDRIDKLPVCPETGCINRPVFTTK